MKVRHKIIFLSFKDSSLGFMTDPDFGGRFDAGPDHRDGTFN